MGSTSSNTVTFEDKSDYIFRNSSTKKGGFRGNIGRQTNNTDLTTVGDEDVNRTTDSLGDPDRTLVRDQLTTIATCIGPNFCADKTELETKASYAWDRAISLFADTRAEIFAQLEDLKTEAIERICLRRNQWARTAGSSLNCLVQSLELKAEVELTRRLGGVLAERMPELKAAETQAIMAAFDREFNARMETTKVGFSQIGNLWAILRGAQVVDVTARDYSEQREEDVVTFNLSGEFYHEQVDIADTDGKYTSVGDEAISTSQGIASIIGALG